MGLHGHLRVEGEALEARFAPGRQEHLPVELVVFRRVPNRAAAARRLAVRERGLVVGDRARVRARLEALLGARPHLREDATLSLRLWGAVPKAELRAALEGLPTDALEPMNGLKSARSLLDVLLRGDIDGERESVSFALALSAVRSATIGLDGDRIQGTGCTLAVVEETDLALEGACGPNPPSPGTPCQIQRLDILDVAGVPTLQAELRCAGLPARDAPGLTRAVTGPAGGATFATLELTGCAGL